MEVQVNLGLLPPGKETDFVAAVDMEAVVKDVWEELKAANHGRSMTLKIESMTQGMGDRVLIKESIANILSNAVKFSGSRARSSWMWAGTRREARKYALKICKGDVRIYNSRFSAAIMSGPPTRDSFLPSLTMTQVGVA